MTTTTEPAPSTNKRMRTDDASASSQTGPSRTPPAAPSAASPAPLTLHPRLHPIKDVLAAQPDQLRTSIISKSKEMLDLRGTISTRESRYQKFLAPQPEPTTRAEPAETTGITSTYIPNSLRSKCPLNAAEGLANDPEMLALLASANAAHEKHIILLANKAKEIAELEICLLKRKLRHAMFGLLTTIVLAHDVMAVVRAGKLPDGAVLSEKERIAKVIFDVLQHSSPSIATALSVPNSTELATDFSTVYSFDNTAVTTKMTDADKSYLQPHTDNLQRWLPALTIDLWSHQDKGIRDKQVAAALNKALRTSATAEATDMVDLTITENTTTPAKALTDMVRHEVKKMHRRTEQTLMKELRKNFLGGGKGTTNPPSKPKKNGQKQKEKSAASSMTKPSSTTSAAPSKPNNQRRNNQRRNNKKGKKKKNNSDSAEGRNNDGKQNAPSGR